MGNVLSEDKKQQVVALGRLGWSLRHVEEATAVRRETVSGYLRAAGVAVRGRGGQPKEWPPKPAITPGVSTDPDHQKPAITETAARHPMIAPASRPLREHHGRAAALCWQYGTPQSTSRPRREQALGAPAMARVGRSKTASPRRFHQRRFECTLDYRGCPSRCRYAP